MVRMTRRRFVGVATGAAGAGIAGGLSSSFLERVALAASIPTRRFGKSGPEVSSVGLGGGSRFFEPVPSDEAAADLVRSAIEAGVTIVETSANYGPPEDPQMSERRIGLAMKTHRLRVFLETKTDRRDYDGAMREVERSLKALQTDRIDLMLHHNLSSGNELGTIAGANGAEKAIRKLVEEKVVRFRGFSCHVPALTLEAMERLEPDAIQAPMNATRTPDFEAEVLPRCGKLGIAVVAMKVVGHGFFLREAVGGGFDSRFRTDKNPELHRFAPPAEAFEKPHPSPEEFLRYALTLPITTALVGLDSPATLERIVKAGTSFTPLSKATFEDIHARAQVFSTTGYWIPRPRA